MSKGIDVSRHQGKIDWKRVKESGIEFAMIRAGYGRFDSQKDERFEENYFGAKSNGIKVGTYIYSYAKSVADAREEARAILRWINGKSFEYPIAYDVEENTQAQKGKEFVSSIIKAFCEELEKAGYYVCIYANRNWLINYIDDECKTRYDVWIASWSQRPNYSGNYGMWQYSSDGRVPGIETRVDLDESYKDYPEIMKINGLNGYRKTPVKPDLTKGSKVYLNNTALYISATASKPNTYKTGTYYVYDGEIISGRIRITNLPSRVGKKPASRYVTGYVNVSEV